MAMVAKKRKVWRQSHEYKIYSKTGNYDLLKQDNSKKEV